jgi:hypothetical protein
LFFNRITDWINSSARAFVGLHSSRLNDFDPTTFPKGTTFYETDRTVTYSVVPVNGVNVWRWTSGTYSVASLAVLPTGLGVNDTGLLAYDQALMHLYQWTGTVWQFGPGDPGANFIQAGNHDTLAPYGGVWQKCDGTAGVTVSKGDGTTVTLTARNVYQLTFGVGDGGCFLAAGTPGRVGPSRPSWDTSVTAKTETENAHTHTVGSDSAGSDGAAVTVGAEGATGAGTAHAHNLTDTNAVLKFPSDGNDASNGGSMPDHYRLHWWLRR